MSRRLSNPSAVAALPSLYPLVQDITDEEYSENDDYPKGSESHCDKHSLPRWLPFCPPQEPAIPNNNDAPQPQLPVKMHHRSSSSISHDEQRQMIQRKKHRRCWSHAERCLSRSLVVQHRRSVSDSSDALSTKGRTRALFDSKYVLTQQVGQDAVRGVIGLFVSAQCSLFFVENKH